MRVTPLKFLTIALMFAAVGSAEASTPPMELSCRLRMSGQNLDCQIMGKQRVAMDADDVGHIIDAVEDKVYIHATSRHGIERMFLVDANAASFKKLNKVKKSSSMSEIAAAKNVVFDEIEKRVI